MFCSGACDALGGVLARAFWRMRVAGAGGTHSLASPIVSTVVFFVSFKIISLVIIMSVHGGNVACCRMHSVCAR